MTDGDAYRAWLTVLDSFEQSLRGDEPPEAALQTVGWTAGPPPVELRARARQVLAAQQRRAREVREELDAAGRQLAALRGVPTRHSVPASAFLDTLA